MFSIVYGALMKGLPYPDGDRIMIIQRANPARGITRQSALPIQDYFDYKAQQHSFSDLATITSGTIYVSGEEKAERFDGSWISANTFDIVGVRPMLGRNFRAGEDTPSGEKVAILAYSTWRERYSGDANIIGKRIRVNGVPYSVVGVMPEGFAFPNNDKIWVPQQADPLATKRGQGLYLQVVGKLKPGVSMDQANVDVATIAKRLAARIQGVERRVHGQRPEIHGQLHRKGAAAAALHHARRGVLRAAHRLRQRRESPARSRGASHEGSRHSHRARRVALRGRPTVSRRVARAVAARRRCSASWSRTSALRCSTARSP